MESRLSNTWGLAVFFLVALQLTTLRAQFLWEVTHTDFDQRDYYIFNVLSCLDEHCIVGGSVVDGITYQTLPTFWSSNDAGSSWSRIGSGLSANDLSDRRSFTDIQYIDRSHLNIVAVGDFGFILRTSNGGITWDSLSFGNNGVIRSVHFFDSLSAILLSYEGAFSTSAAIFTTSDGGVTWLRSAFKTFNDELPGDFIQCRSYGRGKSKVLKSGNGPIYTTNDNWNSIDSTGPIINGVGDPENYSIVNCKFTEGDTIVAFGEYRPNGNFLNSKGLITRTTNSGFSWESPVIFPEFGRISTMTSLNRDTVFAAGEGQNIFLLSTDRGVTWKVDTLKLDTPYTTLWCSGIEVSSGKPVAIFADQTKENIPSILVRGKSSPAFVGLTEINEMQVFPNPASTHVNLMSPYEDIIYRIFDPLGRMVGELKQHSRQATVSIDCSKFANGIYNVFVERDGSPFGSIQFIVSH